MRIAALMISLSVAVAGTPAYSAATWQHAGPDGAGMCFASRRDSEGALGVGANPQGAGIIFTFPSGSVPHGSIPGSIQVDNNQPLSVTFVSGQGGLSVFPAPRELWGQLDAGQRVTVRASNLTYPFSLAGYRDAMMRVISCSSGGSSVAQAPAPAPSYPQSPPSPVPSYPQSPPPAPQSNVLSLVCTGVARYSTQTTSTGSAYNSYGATANGMVTTRTPDQSNEQYRVIIEGNSGKVRVPPIMQPPLGGRGLGGGWWELSDLLVTADQISGKWSHNLLNTPRLVIDRRTGDIQIRGLGGSFTGSCDVAPVEPTGRRF